MIISSTKAEWREARAAMIVIGWLTFVIICAASSCVPHA